MEGHPPHYPPRLYLALLLGAVGLALIAVGITGATGWALIAPGFAAVIIAIPIVWRTQAATLRAASKTKHPRP
jgi:hypothetical protein